MMVPGNAEGILHRVRTERMECVREEVSQAGELRLPLAGIPQDALAAPFGSVLVRHAAPPSFS